MSPTFTTDKGGAFTHASATNQYATTPNLGTADVLSVEAWVKFDTLNTANKNPCVISDTWSGSLVNYSICFAGNNEIKGGYWRGSWTYTSGFTPVVGTWYHIVYTISKSGSNYISTLYQNGNIVGTPISSTMVPANSGGVTYLGRRWDAAEYVNGQIPIYRVYSRALSLAEITQNYNAALPRFTNNPSNRVTITTTESVTGASNIYYAALGTGNKTFSISNGTTGITIDTSTANAVTLRLANTLAATNSTTARLIDQTITAVDSQGLRAATPVYVTTVINPRIIITDQTPGTLTTTFGRTAFDTFTATLGTDTKLFTGVSSAFSSAFVVTNPLPNLGLLTVANNLPAGTYTETITATDAVGATTNYILTVVVNPAPTIAGSPSNSISTTIGRAASLRVDVVGGTGVRRITWTSPNAGITIDTSTVNAQNFLTLSINTSVPANTYSFTLTAIDSTSAQVSSSFTVTVNKWPVVGSSPIVSGGLKIHLDAGNSSSYSGSGTTWTDISGSEKNGTWQQSPTFNTASDGTLSMGTSTSQYMTSAGLGATSVFTAEVWVKFNVIPTQDNCVISDRYSAAGINYSLCFRNDSKITGGYWNNNVWVTTPSATVVTNTWYHFAYTVSLSGTTYSSTLYQNGTQVGAVTTSSTGPVSGDFGLVVGSNWTANARVVDGEIAIVRIHSRALTGTEVVQNYNSQGFRFLATNSGSDSRTVTQGVSASIGVVTATEGTGTKTFALSNTNSGLSLSSSAANTFTLNLPDTLTSVSASVARTITETVTATDAVGATTARVYTVVVNPSIRVESTTAVVTTTSGIVAWDTFTATLGTGNKTFTLSRVAANNGFTLTQANNVAVLRIPPTMNPGTYFETVTATDSVGAVTSVVIRVIVNPGPTITGPIAFASTAGYAFTSPTYSAANGTGTLRFTLTAASGIALSATTGSPNITVATSVTAGTYNLTLRVTDSATATSTFAIVLTVNPPVALDGNKTLSKVYGEELVQVYQTSSGTAPFSIFSSAICTSEKSTYIGNGTNGILNQSYTVEKFSGIGTCSWVAPTGVSTASVLTVAGGGGGGGNAWAGGGGGGGVVSVPIVSLTTNQSVSILVGSGGNGGTSNSTCTSGSSPSQGSNGANSSFNGTYIAVGGGGGGGYGWTGYSRCGDGQPGGSGGGSGETFDLPPVATSNQTTYADATVYGNSGGVTRFTGGIQAGSGGGGAGALGGSTALSQDHVAGNGGNGVALLITGTSTTFAGGGGGATCSGCSGTPTVGSGGSGGGGTGGNNSTNPTNGINGLGGGGGGSQTASGGKGGSGVVILRYLTPAVDSETTRLTMTTLTTTPTGSLQLNAPRLLPVGTYTQTITVTDATGSTGSTPVSVTLTVSKATPTLALSLPGSAATTKYGNPVTISALATTGGNVTFRNGAETITACASVSTTAGLATCSWTPTSLGAVALRAILTPTDTANYNSSALTTLNVTVAKADTLTVTVAAQTLTYTAATLNIANRFTFSGLAPIDTITAIAMRYSGTANDLTSYESTTAPTKAGSYTISPNFPANAAAYTFGTGSLNTISAVTNYESITVVAGTFTVNRAIPTRALTYADSNTVTFSDTATIAATDISRLGAGLRTFSTSTPLTCSVDSATALVSVVAAGSCIVTMDVAQDANYLATTINRTITINKASRTFTLTPAISTLKYGETTTVTSTISAGSLDGAIAFTMGATTGCLFDSLSGQLTAISGLIQCPLTATIAEGANYLAATTANLAITIARASAPLITIKTVTAVDFVANTRALITPTVSVTGFKNLDTFGSLTLSYSFVSNPFEGFAYSDTRTPIDAGIYAITPSNLTLLLGDINNYETPTYGSRAINFTINRINQETLTVESTNGEVDVPFTLRAIGGNSNGALTFTKISGAACSVSGNQLSATQAGACVITVTMAGSRNYLPITSESVTVRVRNFVLIQIFIPSNPNTGITIAPTVPLVKGPDVCTVDCVPTITNSSIYEGVEGDLVLLSGANLATVNKVYFNIYTEAPNFLFDPLTLRLAVRVPAGLPEGDATIEVISPGGTSARYFDFFILP